MTNLMKALLALVILVLCALGFWLLDWQEKQVELAALQTARAESQERLASTRALVAELPTLVKEKERLDRELLDLGVGAAAQGRAELFVARFVDDLERVVLEERRRSGDPSFTILSITPGAQVATAEEGAPALPSRGFQLSLQGRYDTVVGFLHRLGERDLGGPVTLNRLTLAPTGAGDGAPVLAVTLPVTAWLTGP